MAINPLLGQSSQYFGHADYEAALRGGSTNEEILRYLNNNLGQLRGDNVPGGVNQNTGGPGLFGEVQANYQAELDNTITSLEERLNQQTADFAGIQEDFRRQIAQQSSMLADQQAAFTSLQNSQVPAAEQTAQEESTSQVEKKTKAGTLSSLQIVSGLGTQTNPLSGLQLA